MAEATQEQSGESSTLLERHSQAKPLLQRAGHGPPYGVRLPADRDDLGMVASPARCTMAVICACLVPLRTLGPQRRCVNRSPRLGEGLLPAALAQSERRGLLGHQMNSCRNSNPTSGCSESSRRVLADDF